MVGRAAARAQLDRDAGLPRAPGDLRDARRRVGGLRQVVGYLQNADAHAHGLVDQARRRYRVRRSIIPSANRPAVSVGTNPEAHADFPFNDSARDAFGWPPESTGRAARPSLPRATSRRRPRSPKSTWCILYHYTSSSNRIRPGVGSTAEKRESTCERPESRSIGSQVGADRRQRRGAMRCWASREAGTPISRVRVQASRRRTRR